MEEAAAVARGLPRDFPPIESYVDRHGFFHNSWTVGSRSYSSIMFRPRSTPPLTLAEVHESTREDVREAISEGARRGAAAGFLGHGTGGATAAPAVTGGDRGVLLVARHRAFRPFLGGGGSKKASKKAISSSSRRRRKVGLELSFHAEDGVWRKEILMEEQCQSLDFSGMIYYDVAGRRLEQPPPPRTLLCSPLPSSAFVAEIHGSSAAKERLGDTRGRSAGGLGVGTRPVPTACYTTTPSTTR
uniref:Uncharacterized protein n=1 Tax=Oryza rufipogon TaxID=4529 RepID=A0A0E0RDN5_ORYRU